MKGKVAIVGWAQSQLTGRNEQTHKSELLSATVMKALKQSGLTIKDIDTVIDCSCDVMEGTSISNVYLIESIGAFLKEESKVEEDGAYGVLYAYLRLLAGNHRTAMVVAHGRTDTSQQFYSWMMTDPFLLRPLGVELISAFALQAQSYLSRYKLDSQVAVPVVIKNRSNGSRNPNADLRIPVTEEEVLNSPVVASPLRRLDIAPASEGAAVLILASAERAREVTDKPVWIEGVGFNQDGYYLGHRDLFRPESLRRAARMAYEQAGIRNPMKETDFAEVYEPVSYGELMIYEGLGLTDDGKGYKLLQEGQVFFDGSYPVNPSGGALCGNPIMVTGLIRLIEAARQLSGEAGEYQLKKDVRRAIVHSTSGLCFQSNIVYILGKDTEKRVGKKVERRRVPEALQKVVKEVTVKKVSAGKEKRVAPSQKLKEKIKGEKQKAGQKSTAKGKARFQKVQSQRSAKRKTSVRGRVKSSLRRTSGRPGKKAKTKG